MYLSWQFGTESRYVTPAAYHHHVTQHTSVPFKLPHLVPYNSHLLCSPSPLISFPLIRPGLRASKQISFVPFIHEWKAMSEEVTIVISSNPPPRPSILRIPSTSRSAVSPPSSSSSAPSSISFAPLPKVEGKKRRSRRPIGLKGRAELLQESRQRLAEAMEAHEDDFFGGDYEFYEHEEEIPLPDIGKLVKGLWRSISRITLKEKQTPPSIQSIPASTVSQADNLKSEQGRDADAGADKSENFGETSKDRRDGPDTAGKLIATPSTPEIPPESKPSDSAGVDEERTQIKISTVSTTSSKDLDVLPKGLDDLIQVSVINTLKVQSS